MSFYHRKQISPHTFIYTIAQPHPPEINAFTRDPLFFYLSEPQRGVNEETIPLLIMNAHDELGPSSYRIKMQEDLAQKNNFLVFSVDFLGLKCIRGIYPDDMIFRFDALCETRVNEKLQARGYPKLNMSKLMQGHLAENLLQYMHELPANLHSIEDPILSFSVIPQNEHFDFGLVQVMDCLWAVRAIQLDYPKINWTYLTSSGLSHGGYLATQCAKLAPHTFALIINGYGWVKPYLPWMIQKLSPGFGMADNIPFSKLVENYWSEDPQNPYFLDHDRLLIRTQDDAQQIEQWRKQTDDTQTHFVFTQQIDDEMHNRSEKESLIKKMRAQNFSLEFYTDEDYSKTQIRTLSQGNQTSQKGLIYDFATSGRYEKTKVTIDDFSRKSRINYHGSKKTYTVDFSHELPRVIISQRKMDP